MRNSLLLVIVLFLGCVQHKEDEIAEISDSTSFKIDIKYAEGFDIIYEEGISKIITHSIRENEYFRDSLLFIHDMNLLKSVNPNKVFQNISTLACQSSTYLAFIKVLGHLEVVKGLCGVQYVQNSLISAELGKNHVKEICLGEGVQLETLLEVKPELFLIYPFEDNNQGKFNRNGIKTLLIAEYLEKTQLARLEWIKVFGMVLGEEEKAVDYFNNVEQEYLKLKKTNQDLKNTFILNLPYKDLWYMPSAQSLTVEILQDAGMTYFYNREVGTENVLHSKEEVWNDAMNVEYWVIIASRKEGYTLDDLITEEAVYAEFKSVKNNHVIFCNTATSDYFSQGAVEPHIMLKDLLYATGQIDNHVPKYFRLLE